MSVLDVPRPVIASPFVSDTAAAAFFDTLFDTSEDAADISALFLGDSTGNQTDEWWSVGWTAFLAANLPAWRVLYYGFNDGTTSWPTSPTVIQAGTPVGDPTPVDGVVATDDGSGSGELVGSTSSGGQVWEGVAGYQSRVSGKIASTGAGLFDSRMPIYARGDVTFTAQWGVANNEGSSKQYRVGIWKDATNYCRINIVGSTTKTITLIVVLAGVSRTVATFTAGAIPAAAAYAEYAMSLGFTLTDDGLGGYTGGTIAGLVNATNASGALTADEAAMLAQAEFITYGSNSTTGTIDTISVDVDGISTFGPFKILRLYNGSVSGTTLDYQTSDANASRRTVLLSVEPEVVFLSGGHNYDSDTPSVFLGKVLAAVNEILDNTTVDPGFILTSQNPEFVGLKDAAQVAAHDARQRAIRRYARAAGWGYIPAFEVFASRHDGGASLIDPDGIHPNYGTSVTLAQGNGSMLWADALVQYLAAKYALA